MSFILDALRKSEARRQHGEGPDLSRAPRGNGSGSRRRSGPGRWLSLGLLLVVAVVVAGAGWTGRDLITGQIAQWTGSAPTQPDIPPGRPLLADQIAPSMAPFDRALAGRIDPPDSARAERERRSLPEIPAEQPDDRRQASDMDRALPRERVISDPEEIEAELARRIAQEQAAGEAGDEQTSEARSRLQRRRQAPMDPAQVAEIERRVAAAEAQRRELEREAERASARETVEPPRVAEMPDRPRATEPTAETEPSAPATIPDRGQPWRPSDSVGEYVRAWELPLSIRRNMPELKLTIHVYSADEAQRFVLVNGERFVVGDQLAQGAQLVDIRREGAVVDFRDYRFLLEP